MLELDPNYFNFLNELEVDCQSSSDNKEKIWNKENADQ